MAQQPTTTTATAPAPGEAGWSEPEPEEIAPDKHPNTVWICENPQCPHVGKRRRVNWQHLGQGLYLVGTVRCGCGSLPVREPRGRR